MQRYFMDVKRFVESDPRYTAFLGNVHGANFPPPYHAVIISQIATVLWYLGLGLVFGGDHIFNALGIAEPDFYVYMKNNKMAAIAGLFIMNSVGHNMLSTGAFEIYINDQLVYSKLAMRKMPDGNDLAQALALAGY
jgi:selT/selW/selH-like putative selenoprotein